MMTLRGLNGVAEGGALGTTAATTLFAAASLSGVTSLPLTVTPPRATPPSTVRVSVTEICWPVVVTSWVTMFT
jgi:hypothetical protein